MLTLSTLSVGCPRSKVNTNPGLCGDLVRMGDVGTSYGGGIDATNLGNPCPTLENQSEYQACVSNPSTCDYMCVQTACARVAKRGWNTVSARQRSTSSCSTLGSRHAGPLRQPR